MLINYRDRPPPHWAAQYPAEQPHVNCYHRSSFWMVLLLGAVASLAGGTLAFSQIYSGSARLLLADLTKEHAKEHAKLRIQPPTPSVTDAQSTAAPN
jgi:hypothetical protein